MTFASFRTTPWKGWLSCFCWFTRRVGRKWKERICDFESTAVAQLYCKLQFFSFFGSEWSWLSRTVLSWLWGMILVIQTWTGRVLSKFTVLLSQLRLFWLEIWKLMMVLVFFLCVGCFLDFWLGIVQNDWFTGKTQLIPEQKVNGQTRGN